VSPAAAASRFATARVARFATVDENGRPHLVPIVFAVEGQRIYHVVDAKPKRTTALRRVENVRSNPRVSALVDHYDDGDWDALWWARADGLARVLDPDEAEAAHAVELLAVRYPQQRAAGAVVAIDVERWSGWHSRPV
jgi:PPOX class probable F420-dependent enzyme